MPVGRAGSDKAHTEYNHHVLTRQTVRRTAHEEASKQGRGNRSHNPVIQAFSNMHAAQFAASQARRETLAVVQIDMRQSSPATWQGAWTEALFPANVTVKRALGCWKCWDQQLSGVSGWPSITPVNQFSTTYPAKRQGIKGRKIRITRLQPAQF